jgi:cytochrome c peroxidase
LLGKACGNQHHSRVSYCFVALAASVMSACGGGGGGKTSTTNDAHNEAPHAPIVLIPDEQQIEVLGYPVNLDINKGDTRFTDPNGDPLTFEVNTLPPGLSLSGSLITGIPTLPGLYHLTITAKDPLGLPATATLTLNVKENSPPRVAKPNLNQVVEAGRAIDYDALQSGSTFVDDDGHALTSQLTIVAAPAGFSVQGSHITGTFHSTGYAKVSIVAMDAYGGSAEDSFALVVPQQFSGRPTLPTSSFVYDDARLPMPPDIPKYADNSPVNRPTDAGATLGRVLFYDKRLSITNTHSCGSCHQQVKAFANGQRIAVGALGDSTARSPMSLINVRFNFSDKYFSDHRVSGLESLVLMPIEDRTELGSPLSIVIEKLAATDFYPPLFAAAFGSSEITSERISLALGQFLRSIISYRSKFDDIRNANDLTPFLTSQEIAGLHLFDSSLCSQCHNGFSTMSSVENNGIDVASNSEDGAGFGEFRAGSFRNIAKSAPYMHDGRFSTLREVIDFYSSNINDNPHISWLLAAGGGGPKRFNFTEEEKFALEAFLNTLTDEPLLADPKFSDPFEQ